ncbi:MAG: hypothetical protein JWM11_84 [Planctomycetaceae bacterium]|nr:hypothetical protein [Planctomycetaceae bacterium]
MRLLMTRMVMIVTLFTTKGLLAEENPLLKELLTQGVRVSKEATVLLPAATLSDGMSAAVQRQQITAIPDNRQSWENLTRKSVVAPFVMKISQPEEGAGSIGRHVDLWFVAYGKLERLNSEEFLQGQFQDARESNDGENRPRIQFLGNEALRERGLKVPGTPADPRYLSVEMSLLERVRISGTTRSVKTSTPHSVTVASVLDSRFDQDPEFSNSWRTIERDASGRRQYGPRQTYHRMGSYV